MPESPEIAAPGKQVSDADRARDAYIAHGRAIGAQNYRGDVLPAWEDLGETIQQAWIDAIRETEQIVSNSTLGCWAALKMPMDAAFSVPMGGCGIALPGWSRQGDRR